MSDTKNPDMPPTENDPLAQWWKEDAERYNAVCRSVAELCQGKSGTPQEPIFNDKFAADAPPADAPKD